MDPDDQLFALECSDTIHAGDGYDVCTGTSMATPYVSGIAGLIRSVNPLISNENTYNLITGHADRAGNWDPRFGYGVPDANASVLAALGKSDGSVVDNRLTPLFSMYSDIAY